MSRTSWRNSARRFSVDTQTSSIGSERYFLIGCGLVGDVVEERGGVGSGMMR